MHPDLAISFLELLGNRDVNTEMSWWFIMGGLFVQLNLHLWGISHIGGDSYIQYIYIHPGNLR